MKHITGPGWIHEIGAQGWCTGQTQRDGMRREAGQGIRMGTHVNPRLFHVNVWQKQLQYCKVISLQLIKLNEKKKSQVSYIIRLIICCSVTYHYLSYYVIMFCFPKKILSCPTLLKGSRNSVFVESMPERKAWSSILKG